MRKIGVHLSIAGGIYRALERARSLDINSTQIFLKNSNQWESKPYSDEDINRFSQLRSAMNSFSIAAHSGYLINLAGDVDNLKKSIAALKDELCRAQLLDIEYLVLHPGSHRDKGVECGIRQVASALNSVYSERDYPTSILLETTAGQGSSVGHRFEHLRDIIDRSKISERLGICLDTCHVYAAGYDISEKDSYEKVISDFDTIIGLPYLKLIHLNDSKKDLGSMVDRHEHIGEGAIGDDGLSIILNDPKLLELPFILETPKFNNDEADIMNLSRARKLIHPFHARK